MAGVKGRSGGQNRKTTHKLILEGGFRKARHSDRVDVLVESAELIAPEHLGEVGRGVWDRVTKSLPKEALSNLDFDALVQFCDMAEAYAKLRPVFISDPIDKDVRCSYMAVVASMDKLGRQFGWTPISRAALKAPEKKDEVDPFAELASRFGTG